MGVSCTWTRNNRWFICNNNQTVQQRKGSHALAFYNATNVEKITFTTLWRSLSLNNKPSLACTNCTVLKDCGQYLCNVENTSFYLADTGILCGCWYANMPVSIFPSPTDRELEAYGCVQSPTGCFVCVWVCAFVSVSICVFVYVFSGVSLCLFISVSINLKRVGGWAAVAWLT